MSIEMRKLGSNGPAISALSLGCMGMSGMYGPADEAESLATIRAAVDGGINYLDTGDFYGMGHNEMLIGRALKEIPRDKVLIGVKFGALRSPKGDWVGYDARPAAVKNFLAYSLRRLGTDYIDLYQPARVDRMVPIEDTAGAIAEMIQAGYVRHLGLSEASSASIRKAHAVHPVAALQYEYSILTREVERELLPTIRELGIALVAYGVLSRGLLSDSLSANLAPGDFRAHSPRFSKDNLGKNLALRDAMGAIAKEKGCSVAQLAIAWVLAQGDDVIALVGARRRDRLQEAMGALNVKLSAEDLAKLAQAVPAEAVAGERYPAQAMAMLNG
ncbi:MAG TPA: aldo/keto reductase [Bryobacteraceae bacterium]|nr:aldo/keto reductase [Bryobacteraceae bacterium]